MCSSTSFEENIDGWSGKKIYVPIDAESAYNFKYSSLVNILKM